MSPDTLEDRAGLNKNHVRRLRITCEHIDDLLCRIEEALYVSTSKAAFPHYTPDLSPAQQRTIEDYIARIRAQLVRVLDGQGISRDRRTIPVSRAIAATLVSVDISVEELRPKYMRGFGNLAGSAPADLDGIAGELKTLVTRLDRLLAQGAGQDLKERLHRLEQAGNDLELISRTEKIVADRGLVEFRAGIAAILDRAEDRTFEIAVFGRVSSGKSSLLNAVLGTEILPVGVTPVTAIPTRILYGGTASFTVSFADASPKTLEIGHLGEYVTEQQNPGNAKHVARITVFLPAIRLRDGVSFVDTPGLGSLATKGAAETLAYLPKCDLGIVLVDAGSTLTDGDLQTISALQEAAVPVTVLLSKTDLLSPQDCEKILRYVREHIASGCGDHLPVHPVSVRPSHRNLLDAWFNDEILPLYSRSQELRAASLQRKIGTLRESVVAALRLQLRRSRERSPLSPDHIRAVEARLRRATGLIEQTRLVGDREIEKMTGDIPMIFRTAASAVRGAGAPATGPDAAPDELIHRSIVASVHERTGNVRESFTAMAQKVQDELVQAAKDLGMPDMPEGDEFRSLVRDLPVFEPGTVRVSVAPSTFASLLGKEFAEEQLAARIRREYGRPFETSLAGYGKMVKEWMRVTADRLGQRFGIYAESYRAQAERSLNRQDLTEEEIRAVEEDLLVLGGNPCDGISATFSEPELPDGYP